MISEIPNTNEAIVPGSKVILTADEKKISIDCTGDYVSLVGLCGVFIADMLSDIAFYETESFDDAAEMAEIFIKKSIDRARETKERGMTNGEH